MSDLYNKTDVEQEIELLTPRDVSLSRLNRDTSGADFLRSLKSIFTRLVNTDPDAILGLLQLGINEMSIIVDDLLADLAYISSNLTLARTGQSTVNVTALENLKTLISDIPNKGVAGYTEQFTRIKNTTRELVNTFTRSGLRQPVKDGHELSYNIRNRLATFQRRYETVRTTQRNFLTALETYANIGGTANTVEELVTPIVDRLSEFSGTAGQNVSRAVLTATVAVGLLEERNTYRTPLGWKYYGLIQVLLGTPSYAYAFRSLPLFTESAETTNLEIDNETGTLEIPSSTLPSMVLVPNTTNYNGGTSQWEDYFDAAYPNYSGGDIRVLINNSTYTVSTGVLSDANDLATALNGVGSGDDTLAASVVDGNVIIENDEHVYGTKSRIAFYNTSGTGSDGNADLGLTFEVYGTAQGEDVGASDLAFAGFTAVAPSLGTTKQIVVDAVALQPLDDTTFDFGEDYGITTFDVLVVHSGENLVGASYKIASINGTEVTVSTPILGSFDGNTFTAPDSVTMSVSVVREIVRIQGESRLYGVSDVEVSGDNPLQLQPVEAEFTDFALEANPDGTGGLLEEGSPIRVGDVLYRVSTTTPRPIATVRGQNGSFFTTEPVVSSSISDAMGIKSRGAYLYGNIISEMQAIRPSITVLSDIDKLKQFVDIYLGSGTNLGLAQELLSSYTELLTDLKQLIDTYDTNIPMSIKDYMRNLTENRLIVPYRLLLSLDIGAFYDLETSELSEIESMGSLLDAISSNLGINQDFYEFEDDRTTYDIDDVPDEEVYDFQPFYEGGLDYGA